MISVLILDGFSDSSICSDNSMLSDISDVYIPLLVGIMRFNGLQCSTVKPNGLQYEYSLKGTTDENLIYVPAFTCADKESSEISFVYADSTFSSSASFRIASRIRRIREDRFNKVIFVNELHENDALKKYSPVVVDNIRFSKSSHACDNTDKLYKYALSTAFAVCEYYGVVFRDPAE